MSARERFLNYVFSIFVNCEDCAGDHVCPLLMCAHQDSKGFAFACARSLDQATLFICITRGKGQALSPRPLESIGLGRLSFQLAGAKQEG